MSEAVPLTLIVPDTVAPAEGDWIEIFGTVVSTPFATVTVTEVQALFADVSVARTMIVCVPFA